MSTTDERLSALETRLRAVEDELAVVRVVTSYGPLIDLGEPDSVAALWEPTGVYDVDTGVYDGHEGIGAMVASDAHRGLLARGCAHLLTAPHVTVDGDTAVAVGHSQLVVLSDRGYRVARATAHRWELARHGRNWKVVRRTSRVLDGSAVARELLRLPTDSETGPG